jgi:hypothetical protein
MVKARTPGAKDKQLRKRRTGEVARADSHEANESSQDAWHHDDPESHKDAYEAHKRALKHYGPGEMRNKHKAAMDEHESRIGKWED